MPPLYSLDLKNCGKAALIMVLEVAILYNIKEAGFPHPFPKIMCAPLTTRNTRANKGN